MDAKDLRCFQRVYEEQSINRAAQKLFITPQGLGKNIQNLERELNTTLFERTSHGVKPTGSAALLYGKADAFIRQMEEMKNEIEQLENQGQTLRIGCAYGVLHLLPLPLIRQFTLANEPLRVEWCEYSNREVKELLKASRIDYGFTVGNHGLEGFEVKRLTQCPIGLLVYAGHPLYGQKTVTLDQLREEPLLMMNENFQMYSDVMEACRARGFAPNIVAKTMDGAVLCTMCLQKMGLAVIPDFLTRNLRMDGLCFLPFAEELSWEVYGAYKKRRGGPEPVRRFDRFLQQNLK